MMDERDTRLLEQLAATTIRSWEAREASRVTRFNAVANRAQAMTARLRAQHEVARARSLRMDSARSAGRREGQAYVEEPDKRWMMQQGNPQRDAEK